MSLLARTTSRGFINASAQQLQQLATSLAQSAAAAALETNAAGVTEHELVYDILPIVIGRVPLTDPTLLANFVSNWNQRAGRPTLGMPVRGVDGKVLFITPPLCDASLAGPTQAKHLEPILNGNRDTAADLLTTAAAPPLTDIRRHSVPPAYAAWVELDRRYNPSAHSQPASQSVAAAADDELVLDIDDLV